MAEATEQKELPENTENQTFIGLSDADIQTVEEALEEGNTAHVEAVIADLGTVDTAELLSKVSDENRQTLLDSHGHAIDAEVFTELAPELSRTTLESMSAEQVAKLISDLDSDDALDLIVDLSPIFQKEILRKLSGDIRVTLEEGLRFPEYSAGRLMQREFVAVPDFWTVGKTIDYLRDAAEELPSDFFDIFIITPTYRITGEMPLNRLVRSRRDVKVKDLTLDTVHPIPATLDQEEVAQLFRRENLTSAPVVDEEDRLIGVITIDDVVDVIDEEAQEDFMKMAGVDQDDLYRAILSTTTSRFRWLFINLLTAIAASVVISFFDATIQQVVALAVLMPIVASMGGNAGTQALAVAVRALATRELSQVNAVRIIWKETVVGVLNGAAFAIITGIITALWFASPMLGAVIAAAMIINLIVAGMSGAGIPLILSRMGSDPALSSSVFLTTITDIIGFFAFLGLAAIFLI
ncbi:MAG: magnesium transporter [Rhodospirillales bacterium]|nr:magnesium transporter [Rhodospirillales bacterium]